MADTEERARHNARVWRAEAERLREAIAALNRAASVMADTPEVGMPLSQTAFDARYRLAEHLEAITRAVLDGNRAVIKIDGRPTTTWSVYVG